MQSDPTRKPRRVGTRGKAVAEIARWIGARALQHVGGAARLVLLGALTLSGCASRGSSDADLAAYQVERHREITVLVATATPDSLATAALLAFPDGLTLDPALALIERAEALAPEHPELVWIHLRLCERSKCEAQARIEKRLQELDPQNGFAWASELERAETSQSEVAVTEALGHMGAATRMTLYWNRSVVMMVDALAVADPSRNLIVRGVEAIGLLAAQTVPPLQPISRACRPEELERTGRREACAALMARLEQSDTALTQGLALGLQARWWPEGSAERALLRAKRRRFDYLQETSGRIRPWRMHHDMAVRLAALRQTAREEDVDIAVVTSRSLPGEPPPEWKDPNQSGT